METYLKLTLLVVLIVCLIGAVVQCVQLRAQLGFFREKYVALSLERERMESKILECNSQITAQKDQINKLVSERVNVETHRLAHQAWVILRDHCTEIKRLARGQWVMKFDPRKDRAMHLGAFNSVVANTLHDLAKGDRHDDN